MSQLISVVITAYNRRSFLLNALKSITMQTFKNYEVIVAKNFYDKFVDDFIKRRRFKEIFIDTKYYGEQVAAAIEEARGDIISFLEDDDEFEQDKLYWVNDAFTRHKAISFFHDTRKYIDREGNMISLINDSKFRPLILFSEKSLHIMIS